MKRKTPQPWERQPKESDPAWEAFVTYRDMPEETGLKRSLSRVGQKLVKSTTMLSKWSSRHNWVKRVRAYDQYRDDLAVAERAKQQKRRIQEEEKMDERHIGMAVQLQKLLLEAIKNTDPDNTSEKALNELTKAVTNAVNLERSSRHATNADRQLALSREMFEYKKERDAGANIEYEDLVGIEEEIYGDNDDTD